MYPRQRVARSSWVCRPRLLPLEDRLAPATLSLSGGVVDYQAADGEANDLVVSTTVIPGQTYLRFEERGAGVTITPSGSGLVVVSPREVRVPTAGLIRADLRLEFRDPETNLSDAKDDALTVALGGLPATVNADLGSAQTTDRLTLRGTTASDTLDLVPRRNADGAKSIRFSHGVTTYTLAGPEALAFDLTQGGADRVTLDRYLTGAERPLSVTVTGDGAGNDTLAVSAPGTIPQAVTLADGSVRVDAARGGQETYLGPSDNIAIDQPKVSIEVIDYDAFGNPVSLGPEFFGSFLLDTGASGVVMAAEVISELVEQGYRTEGQYDEQGVAGFTTMDVSAPYRLDFAGNSGIRQTLEQTADGFRFLSSETVSFGFFGPWGIVGMPAMVNRIVDVDMSRWSNIQDVDDLPIHVEFPTSLPADSGHQRHVPLRLAEFPATGAHPGDPIPTFAPLPLLEVTTRDDGHVSQGEFLLDTGAQLSLISTATALALGLDKNGDGSVEDEALDFIEVGGIGGTTVIPLVAIDYASVSTTEGDELTWSELLVGVLDIEVTGGPTLAGIFGMDMLTSGWANKVLPALVGQPGSDVDGYFRHAIFDFRNASNDLGTMILDLSPVHDNAGPAQPDTLSIVHSGLGAVELTTAAGDDQFTVTSIASGRPLTINAGNGNDTFHVGGGNLDEIDATVTLNGQVGSDRVVLNDQGAVAARTFTVTNTSTTRTSAAAVNYGTVETIEINTGAFNDTVNGGTASLSLTLRGGNGNDTMVAGSGSDALEGGAGNDLLTGGAGNDAYRFDTDLALGGDTINEAGGGVDTLDFSTTTTRAVSINLGNAAAQVINAGLTLTLSAVNTMDNALGGALGDAITGNTRNNALTGGAGNDTLEGGAGSDSLTGGSGNDVYRFLAATAAEVDTVIELLGGGIDRLDFAALAATVPVTVNLNNNTPANLASHTNRVVRTGAAGQAANFENATGGAGHDSILGNDSNNVLIGGSGNDTLSGNGGNDTLEGGAGNDSLAGGAGNDVYLFRAATAAETDTITELAGQGIDRLDFAALPSTTGVTANLASTTTTVATHSLRTVRVGAAGQAAQLENVTGGAGNDTITGNAAGNVLIGGAGNDTLTGGAGNDTLEGGAGSDSLTGGSGNDVYRFLAATAAEVDTVIELLGGGIDRLDFAALAATVPVTVNLNNNTPANLASHTNRVVRTGAAGQAANFENATGGAGHDSILGNDSNNVLIGGSGNDTLNGGNGNDTLDGGSGTDTGLNGETLINIP